MHPALSRFDAATAAWFSDRFEAPSEPQLRAWPAIAGGGHVLLTAPTGSGKTLAAFLSAIDRLLGEARKGGLEDRTRVVYVSPLKALSADIHRNLETPLRGILAEARRGDPDLPPIRAALRTGDTPPSLRAQTLRRPPHILVTTPESLYLLLTSKRGRGLAATADTVIVDEIHALARDKRGSHLALTLERLDHAAGRRLQRIGLSATARPLSRLADFLSTDRTRPPEVLAVGQRRTLDLRIEVPGTELGAVATHEVMEDIQDRLAELIREHRTTLVFVNTRRMAERLTHALSERLPKDWLATHHGSVAKEIRLEAERRLAAGELRAVVATASLELGLDIGSADLVAQLASPRSISVLLQRVGRSGHWLGAIPRGRLFPTTRDDLVECAALVHAVREGELDQVRIPEGPLDILAQQLAAEAASREEERLALDDLFALVRRAAPYRGLPRRAFDAVIATLADGVATSRGRRGALLHLDGVSNTVRPRRGTRIAALLNGGAIPETGQYQVVAEPDDRIVGQIDEDFAVESMRGDVFLLGTTSWRIRRIAEGQVRVEDAAGAAPTIPFWRGEAPGRTDELSAGVAAMREFVDAADPEQTAARLSGCGLDGSGADQLARYLAAGRAALGAMPSPTTVVAERFFDETGGQQLVLHAPFGSRINRAWGLALRKRFCRSFNVELQAAATDDGIVISLTDLHSFPLESVFRFLKPQTVERVLRQAVLGVPLFDVRWRWTATRALAVPRRRSRGRVPPPIQRMLADDLLAAVFPDQAACAENLAGEVRIPEHPLVDETLRDALDDALDLDGLKRVLEAIGNGGIRTVARETPEPSPFAAEILNANPFAFLDPAPLEERRSRAVRMRGALPPSLDAQAVLEPAAIERAAAEAAPLVRDADELHDALLTHGAVPAKPEWAAWFGELERAGRAVAAALDGSAFWAPVERLALVRGVWPDAVWPEAPSSATPHPEPGVPAAAEVVRGLLDSSGPWTVPELAGRLRLSEQDVGAALAALESEGTAVQGRFRPGAASPEWCHRRVLARIHRLTLAHLRRQSAPVSAARFLDFLPGWQHAAPDAVLHGPTGVRQVVAQLQGLEAPAAAWESRILPLRIRGYRRDWLDRNCLSGEIVWARVSAPAPTEAGGARLTRAAPVALLLRRDLSLWLQGEREEPPGLSAAARTVLGRLETHGAQFFFELERSTGLLPSSLEDALWELAAAGAITSDGFDSLRALMDPRRRSATGRHRRARARYGAGRWARLTAPAPPDPDAADEALARQLLERWGVVFRDLLKRERLERRWRRFQLALRRLEMRGEVVGGRFVSAFAGEQFALSTAVETLRRAPSENGGDPGIRISPADPLNLSGILVPGPRTPVTATGALRLQAGAFTPSDGPDRDRRF